NTVIVGPAVTIAGGSTINIKLGTVKTGGDGYVLIDANRYAPRAGGAPTVIRGLSGWGTGPVAVIDRVGMTVPAFSGLITNNRIPWLQFDALGLLDSPHHGISVGCNACQANTLPDGTTGFRFTNGIITSPTDSAIWIESASLYPMNAVVQ